MYNIGTLKIFNGVTMQSFYMILLGASGVYLTAQLAAYLFYGKIFFPNAGILFQQRKNRFEWQMVFPKNLLLLVIFIFSTSLFGLVMELLGVVGWLSLPLGAVGGLAVNFLINAVIAPAVLKAQHSAAPTDEQLEEANAVVLEDIPADGYGRIKVKHGSRSYYFDAVSANDRLIERGERVVVLYAQDGLCFVEAEAHLFDILFEQDAAPSEEQAAQEQAAPDEAEVPKYDTMIFTHDSKGE